MIHISFQEPTDSDWLEWRGECEAAREVLVALHTSREVPTISDLYKDARMKRIYKSGDAPFYGKCAYCECDVLVNQPGDIEHWRPKSRVIDGNAHPIQIVTADGDTVPHPGYYWLAYDWRNLLLACEDCNRPSKGKTAGKRIGKWDQFPVRGFRAVREGEEDGEEPLLINPVDEDPSDHLEIEVTGVVIAKTDRGRTCRDVFGLNAREALVNARVECIKKTKNELKLASLAAVGGDDEQLREFLASFQRIISGASAFSAAARAALRHGKENLEDLVSKLGP